jgi:aryl-alcohol dehydrogenase-like predicted oxidoreductase
MPLAAANEETITIGGDLTVGRIGYGAMQLTGDQVWGEYPDHDGGIALLRHVVNSGITFIDTADVYGPHSNELLIREALYPYPTGSRHRDQGRPRTRRARVRHPRRGR